MADDDWRFAVEDVGDANASESAENDPANGTGESGEPEVSKERPPLEPGSPSLENTLFVLLGVFVTVLVIARVAALVVG